jgi:hypothetical protein
MLRLGEKLFTCRARQGPRRDLTGFPLSVRLSEADLLTTYSQPLNKAGSLASLLSVPEIPG